MEFESKYKLFIQEKAFENVCEMAAILSRGRWVKDVHATNTLPTSDRCQILQWLILQNLDESYSEFNQIWIMDKRNKEKKKNGLQGLPSWWQNIWIRFVQP